MGGLVEWLIYIKGLYKVLYMGLCRWDVTMRASDMK